MRPCAKIKGSSPHQAHSSCARGFLCQFNSQGKTGEETLHSKDWLIGGLATRSSLPLDRKERGLASALDLRCAERVARAYNLCLLRLECRARARASCTSSSRAVFRTFAVSSFRPRARVEQFRKRATAYGAARLGLRAGRSRDSGCRFCRLIVSMGVLVWGIMNACYYFFFSRS